MGLDIMKTMNKVLNSFMVVSLIGILVSLLNMCLINTNTVLEPYMTTPLTNTVIILSIFGFVICLIIKLIIDTNDDSSLTKSSR